MDIGTLVASIGADISDLKRGVNEANTHLRKYSKTTDRELKKSSKEWKAHGQLINGVIKTVRAATIGYFTVLGTRIVTDFTKDIIQAGVQLDSLNRSLVAITGTTVLANKQFQFTSKIAKEYGLNLRSLEQSYKNILAASQGTELAGKKIQKVFLAVNKASAVLGLSADDTSGVLRALSQMISKGTVQAEELRGQLGERLPGAFQMAAEAMGVTTAKLGKMMEMGQVTATELLPKLADVLENRYGKAAKEAGESSRAAFEHFHNSILAVKRSLANSGILEFFADMAEASAKIMDLFTGVNQPGFREGLEKRKKELLEVLKSEEQKKKETIKRLADFEIEEEKRKQKELADLNAKRSMFGQGMWGNTAITKPRTKEDIRAEAAAELELVDAQLRELATWDNLTKKMKLAKEAQDKLNAATETAKNKLSEIEQEILNSKIDESLKEWFQVVDDLESKINQSNFQFGIVQGARAADNQTRLLATMKEQKAIQDELIRQEKEKQKGIEETQKREEQRAKFLKKYQEEYEKNIKEQQKQYEKMMDDIESKTTSVIKDILKNGEVGFDRLVDSILDSFYDMLAQMAYEAMIKPIIVPVVRETTGATSSLTGSSSSSSGNLLSSFNSLSGNSLNNIGSSLFGSVAWYGVPESVVATEAIASGALSASTATSSAALASAGTASAGMAGMAAAAAPFAALAIMAVPLIMDLLEDEPEPYIGIQTNAAHHQSVYPYEEQGYSSPDWDFFTWMQDSGDPATEQAFTDYFEQKFEIMDDMLNFSLQDVIKNHGFDTGWVDLEQWGNNTEGMLNYLDGLIFEQLYDPLMDSLAENSAMQLSDKGMLDLDFFKEIAGPDGSTLEAYSRFAAIVQDDTDFLDKMGRRMVELGETAEEAYTDMAQLYDIGNMLEDMNMDPYEAAIQKTNKYFDDLRETMEDLSATTEELNELEETRQQSIDKILKPLRDSFESSFTSLLSPILEMLVSPETWGMDSLRSQTEALKGTIDDLRLGDFGDTLKKAVDDIFDISAQMMQIDNMRKVGTYQAGLAGLSDEWTLSGIRTKYQAFVPGMDLSTTEGLQSLLSQATTASYADIMNFTQTSGIGIDELFTDMDNLDSIINETTDSFGDLLDSLKSLRSEIEDELYQNVTTPRAYAASKSDLLKTYEQMYSSDSTVSAAAISRFPDVVDQFLEVSKRTQTDQLEYQNDIALAYQLTNTGINLTESSILGQSENFDDFNRSIKDVETSIQDIFSDPDAAAFFDQFEAVFGTNPYTGLQDSLDSVLSTIPSAAAIYSPIVSAINGLQININSATPDAQAAARAGFSTMQQKYGDYGLDLTNPAVLDDIATWDSTDFEKAAEFTPWADSAADIAADVDWLVEHRDIAGFAGGGSHKGGWRIVGERGPELEYTGPSSIVSSDKTQQLFDKVETISNMDFFETNQILRFIANKIQDSGINLVKLRDYIDKWDDEGLPETRTT